MRINRPRYMIMERESSADRLVIKDLGPWDLFKSVTNCAALVVAELVQLGRLKNDMRLFYYDTAGFKDEMVHKDGEFLYVIFKRPNGHVQCGE